MIHVILHSLLEFAKLLPFLFVSYLLLEWVEHKMKEKTKQALAKGGVFAPAVGGLLGAVPQCGFSSVAAGLYAGKILSLGTLIAVFLSTSDEMLPVILSHATTGEFALWSVVRILLGKVVIGILCGFTIDLVVRFWNKKHGHHHDHDHDHDHHGHHIGEMCEHDGCNCGEKGIWVSSLLHTAKTGAFILLMIFILNTVIHFVGEDNLSLALAWASSSGVGHFIVGLAGLIPNCASSLPSYTSWAVCLRVCCMQGFSLVLALAPWSSSAPTVTGSKTCSFSLLYGALAFCLAVSLTCWALISSVLYFTNQKELFGCLP